MVIKLGIRYKVWEVTFLFLVTIAALEANVAKLYSEGFEKEKYMKNQRCSPATSFFACKNNKTFKQAETIASLKINNSS